MTLSKSTDNHERFVDDTDAIAFELGPVDAIKSAGMSEASGASGGFAVEPKDGTEIEDRADGYLLDAPLPKPPSVAAPEAITDPKPPRVRKGKKKPAKADPKPEAQPDWTGQ